jgi:hypothetical protein
MNKADQQKQQVAEMMQRRADHRRMAREAQLQTQQQKPQRHVPSPAQVAEQKRQDFLAQQERKRLQREADRKDKGISQPLPTIPTTAETLDDAVLTKLFEPDSE